MPRGRSGGSRQGTPGKAYPNRVDLMVNRAPQTGLHTAASAGMDRLAARQPASAPEVGGAPASGGQPPAPFLTPDMTPNATDPTAYPNEPLTAAPMMAQPSQTSEAQVLIRALMMHDPNPDLRRLLARLEAN